MPDKTYPPSVHRMDFVLHGRDDRLTMQLVCESPSGAMCRLTCSENCGAEEYPCGPDDAPHALHDAGYCNAVEFMNDSDDVAEDYIGKGGVVASAPVEVLWQGDYYGWQQPEHGPVQGASE